MMVTTASIHLTAVVTQGVNDLHRTEAMSAVRLTAVLATKLPLARFIKKNMFVTYTNPSHLPGLHLKLRTTEQS